MSEFEPYYRNLRIAKFGGSSMLEMEHVAERMEELDERRLAVVSALGKFSIEGYDGPHDRKITDMLKDYHATGDVELQGEIITRHRFEAERLNELNYFIEDDELDALMDEFSNDLVAARETGNAAETEIQGEIMSAKLFAAYTGAEFIDPRDVIIIDPAKPNGDQLVNLEETSLRLREAMSDKTKRYVLGGYGGTCEGETTLLGRSSTDTVAAAASVALGASYYENFKEVEGVYSADPKKVTDDKGKTTARVIRYMTYDEARDYGNARAEVLHRDVIFYLWDRNESDDEQNITTIVRGLKTPDDPGTEITKSRKTEEDEELVGIAVRDDFVYVKLHEFGMNETNDYITRLSRFVEAYGVESLSVQRFEEQIEHMGVGELQGLLKNAARRGRGALLHMGGHMKGSLRVGIEHMPTNTDSVALVMRKDQFRGEWNDEEAEIDEEVAALPHIEEFIDGLNEEFNERVESYGEINSLHLIGQALRKPLRQTGIFAKAYAALAEAGIGTNGNDTSFTTTAGVIFVNGTPKETVLGTVHKVFFEEAA